MGMELNRYWVRIRGEAGNRTMWGDRVFAMTLVGVNLVDSLLCEDELLGAFGQIRSPITA
jgi:hypothetical protein